MMDTMKSKTRKYKENIIELIEAIFVDINNIILEINVIGLMDNIPKTAHNK